MLQLLKIEWLKLKNYTAFKVLTLLFVVGVLATNYIVFRVMKKSRRNTCRRHHFFFALQLRPYLGIYQLCHRIHIDDTGIFADHAFYQ